jgi:hypothetical protein
MRGNAVWSQDYGKYVSPCFSEIPPESSNIRLTISKCIIRVTVFGFYELWLESKKVKSLNFKEFLKLKNYVKEVRHDIE